MMSHTFTAANGTTFEYYPNKDFTLDLGIKRIDADGRVYRLAVPANDILEFAAEIIKRNQIAKKEGQAWHEVIGGLG